MTLISDEAIKEVMQDVIDNYLIPTFLTLGMNASGQWLKSLQADALNGVGYIKGIDYTYYLVNGRAPGKRPPIQPLIAWVGHKFGIYGDEAKSAAFAIAKKIEREGTEYYPNGTQLLEVLQSQEVTQYVYDKMRIQVNGSIEAQIKRQLNLTFA